MRHEAINPVSYNCWLPALRKARRGDMCRRVINIMLALCTHFLSTQTALLTLNIASFPSLSVILLVWLEPPLTVNQSYIINSTELKKKKPQKPKTTYSAPTQRKLRFSQRKKKNEQKHTAPTQMSRNGVSAFYPVIIRGNAELKQIVISIVRS